MLDLRCDTWGGVVVDTQVVRDKCCTHGFGAVCTLFEVA